MSTPTMPGTAELYFADVRRAWARHCPVCHVHPGQHCHRSYFGSWQAFPLLLPPPWSWWVTEPPWVHFHQGRCEP